MKEFWTKEGTLRVISVLIAALLWLYVVDIQNPQTEEMKKNIPINIFGQEYITDYGLFILEQDTSTINLRLKGRRKELAALQVDNIKATADLRGYNKPGEHIIPIQVELPVEDINILEKRPYNMTIRLDKITEIQKPVEVVPTGKVADSYMALTPQVTPDTVTLRGPSTIINTIDHIKVFVDLNKKNSNMTTRQKFEIFDQHGEPITSGNITTDVDTVEVIYPINKVKKVKVIPQLEGAVNQEYIITGTSVNPEIVEIMGEEEVLDNISEIYTESIYIGNIMSDLDFDIPIKLPNEVSLVNDIETVQGKVSVEKQVSRTFTIDNINVTNVAENLIYNLIDKSLNISLRGIKEHVDKLTERDIYASINLKDLGVGQHIVPVDIRVFSNVEVVGNYQISIILDSQEHEEEQESEETMPINNTLTEQTPESVET